MAFLSGGRRTRLGALGFGRGGDGGLQGFDFGGGKESPASGFEVAEGDGHDPHTLELDYRIA